MPNRTSIPAEITRQILVESGHRCAVCGDACPLERAHIIPWSKSGDNSVENLVCLCANCHERADKEKWGKKTLREFKQLPWILRKHLNPEDKSKTRTNVEIQIDTEIKDFDEKKKRFLQHALAGFLEIPPNHVRILRSRQGSTRVIVQLPQESAEYLIKAYESNNPKLIEHYIPLSILNIQQEKPDREWLHNHHPGKGWWKIALLSSAGAALFTFIFLIVPWWQVKVRAVNRGGCFYYCVLSQSG